jgi:hypothetical protein
VKKPEPTEIEQYAQFGRASLIPGIQKAIDFLQETLDDIRFQLAAADGRSVTAVTRKARKVKAEVRTRESGWSADPEARKKEFARRKRKWKPRVSQPKPAFHPRNPDHPGHQAWLDKIARTKRTHKRELARKVA